MQMRQLVARVNLWQLIGLLCAYASSNSVCFLLHDAHITHVHSAVYATIRRPSVRPSLAALCWSKWIHREMIDSRWCPEESRQHWSRGLLCIPPASPSCNQVFWHTYFFYFSNPEHIHKISKISSRMAITFNSVLHTLEIWGNTDRYSHGPS